MKKTACVLGAAGFIGGHMVRRLKREGYWVRGVDLKPPEFLTSNLDERADHFVICDLRNRYDMDELISYAGVKRDPHQMFAREFDRPFDEIYQFAADMGGAGYIFTGEHDAHIMHNSATINLNLLDALVSQKDYHRGGSLWPKVFYSSSACIYPAYNQLAPNNPICIESSAYPAEPDSEYGWEKLFSERLYEAYSRNYGVPIRVARYHNIYGPYGTWKGGREKAPAAICRKVIYAKKPNKDDDVVIWGDGEQTRSFLYIDDCIDATRMLMESDFEGPVNIGSEEMVTINQLLEIAATLENWKGLRHHDLTKPQGVRGRNSDNMLIENVLGWQPKWSLAQGLEETYWWIWGQVHH